MESYFDSDTQRTNAQLAAILESSDDAIISKDLSGMVRHGMAPQSEYFGYTAAEMIGQSVTILIPAERKHEESHILNNIGKAERVDQYDTVRKRKMVLMFMCPSRSLPSYRLAGECNRRLQKSPAISPNVNERRRRNSDCFRCNWINEWPSGHTT